LCSQRMSEKNMSEEKLFSNLEVSFSSMSDRSLKKAHFIFSVINNNHLSVILSSLVKFSLFIRLPIKGIIRHTVFEHFCGGESIRDSELTIQKLATHGIGTILDYSVEGEDSEKGFDATMNEIIKIITYAKGADDVPFSVFKMSGMGPVEVMAKVSANIGLNSSELSAFNRMKDRVKAVCDLAYHSNVPIMIDSEETWIQPAIDDIVYEMMAAYNRDAAIVYNTYQMYRVDSLNLLQEAFLRAEEQGFFIGAKLVRGAYMEQERERAGELNYTDPIHPDKTATDNSFNEGLKFCVQRAERISVMCGSHNEHSNQLLTTFIEQFSFDKKDNRFWFAQLYGMGDNISFNLAKMGYNVTKYVPYGPVQKVMPYLLRRAKENTSVSGQSSRELQLIKSEMKRRKLLT